MLWWIAGGFGLVAAAFVVSTAVAAWRASAIDPQVLSLRTNALPSVERLIAARTALRHLDTSSAVFAAEPVGNGAADELKTAADGLHDQLSLYLQLPQFPGEGALFSASVQPHLQQLDASVSHLLSSSPGGHARARARTETRLAIDSTDEGLGALVELNTTEADKAVTAVSLARGAWNSLTWIFSASSVLLALGAAAAAIRTATRYVQQRQRDEDRLRTRIDELDVFAVRLAHDVLSPLSAVSLSLAALGRLHGDEPSRRLLARAQRSLLRSRDLASAIYDFARSGGAPAPGERASLLESIRAAAEDLGGSEPEHPPKVVLEPFEDCDVVCEPGVLQCVLANLLSNAAKFSSESAEPRIAIRVLPAGDRVRVEVEDNGTGIPSGLEDAVFDPYFRAAGVAKPGLGLGLAAVKRYVSARGGAVGARRVDHGSVVWFELRRAPGAPAPGDRASPSAPPGPQPSIH